MTRLKKFSVSALTALSLALVPVPAAANGEDLAKVLAGLVALGLVAKAVDDRRDKRKAAQVARAQDDRRIIEGELRRPDWRGNGTGLQNHFTPLPDRCLRVVATDQRDRLVYGKRCLRKTYKYTAHLPGRCERDVRHGNGWRQVYAARCLAREGWRVARR